MVSKPMAHDSAHNVVRKQQIHERITPSGTVIPQQGTSYYWNYAYEGMHPHAPSRIGERNFFYDANGNQTGWLTDGNNTRRNIVWDEENRIQSITDGGETTTFKYNDRGERVVKRGSKGETSYVNQYFTVKNGSQASKHIFAGTTRVVTQMVRPFSPPGGGNGNGPPQGPGPPNPPGPPEEEKEQFFYHPDHLGSTNYVTDYQGKLYEHVEYFRSCQVFGVWGHRAGVPV